MCIVFLSYTGLVKSNGLVLFSDLTRDWVKGGHQGEGDYVFLYISIHLYIIYPGAVVISLELVPVRPKVAIKGGRLCVLIYKYTFVYYLIRGSCDVTRTSTCATQGGHQGKETMCQSPTFRPIPPPVINEHSLILFNQGQL